MKKLYELEYEVEQLRDAYLTRLEYDHLTLEQALEMGFNNIYIKGCAVYIDMNGDCIINGKLIDNKDLLNAELVYEGHEFSYENNGDYLEPTCSFKDEGYYAILEKELLK